MNFKKIDKRAISGQKGANLIERVVLEMEYAWHPTNQSFDAGVDGIIEIPDPQTQRATNCILQVQSKVISGRFTGETEASFEYLCDERDIDYWPGGNVPVVLIVSRPESGEAYWVSVRHAFATPEARKSRRATFRKSTQRFDVGCREQITGLAVPTTLGLYFPAKPKLERLFSNLLPIGRFAETLYLGATDLRRPEEVWARAKERGWDISGEWTLSAGQVLSVHNLRTEPWSRLCDAGTVEAFGTEEWAASDDPDRRRSFVRLANRCLQAKLHRRGVRFVFRAVRRPVVPGDHPDLLLHHRRPQALPVRGVVHQGDEAAGAEPRGRGAGHHVGRLPDGAPGPVRAGVPVPHVRPARDG